MHFAELILAASLITGVADANEDELLIWSRQQPTLKATIRNLALEWELLDPREAEYRFVKDEDLDEDLALIRARHEELKDAPALADGLRFPERDYALEGLRFNRAYRAELEERLGLWVGGDYELRARLREAEALYRVWDNASEVRRSCLYVTARRTALKQLRDQIGEEAFAKGELPPHVPIWRFEVIK